MGSNFLNEHAKSAVNECLGRSVRTIHPHDSQRLGLQGTAEDVVEHWDEIVDQNGAIDHPKNIMIFAVDNMQLLYGR